MFETPARLACWAGVWPGSNESAGRIKSHKTRLVNNYLKAALGYTVALALSTKASRTLLSDQGF